MCLFTLIIFALEIISLVIASNNTLSNIDSTGVEIWCSLSFIIAIGFMYLLGKYLKTIYKTTKFIFSQGSSMTVHIFGQLLLKLQM